MFIYYILCPCSCKLENICELPYECICVYYCNALLKWTFMLPWLIPHYGIVRYSSLVDRLKHLVHNALKDIPWYSQILCCGILFLTYFSQTQMPKAVIARYYVLV